MSFALIKRDKQDNMLVRHSSEICPTSPDCQAQHPPTTPPRNDDTVEEVSNSTDNSSSEEDTKFDELAYFNYVYRLYQVDPIVNYYINRYFEMKRCGITFRKNCQKYYMPARNISMPDIMEEDNPCLPLDFKILLPDFIKASSMSRSKTMDEELSHSVPEDLIYAGQRHHPFHTIVNRLGINQEKVLVVEGENWEATDRNRLNRNRVRLSNPTLIVPEKYPKPTVPVFNNNKEASSGSSADGHSQLPSSNLVDRQEPPQIQEKILEVRRTTNNPQSSTGESTTSSTAFKKTYAASVRQSDSDVQFRRWLDSEFPALLPHSHSANDGTEELAEECKERPTCSAWNETRNSHIYRPNVSTADEPKIPSRQKIPTKSASSPSVPKTREEETTSNHFPPASNSHSSNDSYADSIQETNIEELLGHIRKSLNIGTSSEFEKVVSARSRNKLISEMHEVVHDPKNWNEEYKKRLLEYDIELPYKPKKRVIFLTAESSTLYEALKDKHARFAVAFSKRQKYI